MNKLTLVEYEAIDRIKIDALISLLIDKNVICKTGLSIMINDKIDDLVDCSSKEKIKSQINKFLMNI